MNPPLVLILAIVAASASGCLKDPPEANRAFVSLAEVTSPSRFVELNASDLNDPDLTPIRTALSSDAKQAETTTNVSNRLQEDLTERFRMKYGEAPVGRVVIENAGRYYEVRIRV